MLSRSSYGVFNGYDTEAGSVVLKGNDWGDKNDAKDFLLSADYKVADGFKIGAFGWWGKPYDSDADEDFDVSRYGFNFEWRKRLIILLQSMSWVPTSTHQESKSTATP